MKVNKSKVNESKVNVLSKTVIFVKITLYLLRTNNHNDNHNFLQI